MTMVWPQMPPSELPGPGNVTRSGAYSRRAVRTLVVKPNGVSCHAGRYSCFDDISYNLQRIEQMMRARQDAADARKSYTSLMLADRQAVKDRVREEAEALVGATNRDEVLWETADLLYFVLLHLVGEGVTLDEVLKELRGRAGRRRS